jgi:hypothetical protein
MPFQDFRGNPIANGTLNFFLSDQAVTPTGKIIVPDARVVGSLDVNGALVSMQIWANDALDDGKGFKTSYNVILYTSTGQRCWESTVKFTGGGLITITDITSPPDKVT